MHKGFVIEFSVDVCGSGDGTERFRVHVDVTNGRVSAFEAFTGLFGEVRWVEADDSHKNPAAVAREMIIAQAFAGCALSGNDWETQVENGLPFFNIGTIRDAPDESVPSSDHGAQGRIAELEGELRVRDEQLDAAHRRLEAYDQQFLAHGRAVGVLENDLTKTLRDLAARDQVFEEIEHALGVAVPLSSVEEWSKNARVTIIGAITRIKDERERLRAAPRAAVEDARENIRVQLAGDASGLSLDGAIAMHTRVARMLRDEAARSPQRFGINPPIDNIVENLIGAPKSVGALVRVASGIGVMDLAAEPEKMADACLKIISHERELHRAVCGDLKGCSDVLRGIMGELGVTVPRPSSVDEWPKNVRTTIIEAIDRIKDGRGRASLELVKEAEEFIRVRLAKIIGDKDASLDRCAWIFERVAQELRNEASSWPNRFGVNAPLDGIAINFISDYRVMTTRHDFLERSNTEVRKLVGADSDPMTDTVAAVRDALKQGRDAAGVTAAIVRLAEAQERGLAYLQETTEILKRVHGEE